MTKLPERALDMLGLDAEFIDAVLGDLSEERVERAERDGAMRARLWYWREMARSTPHLIIAALRRGGRGARLLLATLVGAAVVTLALVVVFLVMRDGPPTRLFSDLADKSDAVLLNSTYPVQLSMRVRDARGHSLDSSFVRYSRKSGAPIEVSSTGVVTCTRRGDAVIAVSLGELVQHLVVQCRPVSYVRTTSWVDLIEGGDARELQFVAMGSDDRPVSELRAALTIGDSTVATLSGTNVRPVRAGSTPIEIVIGNRRTGSRVVVHEVVTQLTSATTSRRFVAVRLHLAQGDTVHYALPTGEFWIKYIPLHSGDAPPTIELRGSANCRKGDGIHVKYMPMDVFGTQCSAAAGATVEIAHGRMGAAIVEGFIALDRN